MFLYTANVSEVNTTYDLARLTLPKPINAYSYLRINLSYPLIGEDVAVFGSPASKDFSVTKGVISGYRYAWETMPDWNSYNETTNTAVPISPEFSSATIFDLFRQFSNEPFYIQFDAASSHGTSGGPLINSLGEVVGIDDRFYPFSNSENLNFAIPSVYLVFVMQHMDRSMVKANYNFRR